MEILVDNEYIKLEVEFHDGVPLLHLKVHKWSHNILKKILFPLWHQVLANLKGRGHDVVLAIYREDQPKIGKFHAIMGMHEADRVKGFVISRRWL